VVTVAVRGREVVGRTVVFGVTRGFVVVVVVVVEVAFT
jgi:hypothetical protein